MATLKKHYILIVFIISLGATLPTQNACRLKKPAPIKVGVLHSLTGTMAFSEKSVIDAILLAIEEVNAAGGILGRQIEPLIADGASDPNTFAAEAERLILKEKVSAIFGCWTSASRKSVKPIIEKHKNLLFYPLQYEGLETSPNIIYTGAAPNQQIIPAIKWSRENIGSRFFLIGSDHVFPRTANKIIKLQLATLKGKVVGEEYLPLGSRDFKEVARKIARTRPDVIINTINGDSNIAFFTELKAAGITPEVSPVMSFSITETEIARIGPELTTGHFATWNYFQSLTSDVNKAFVNKFRARYGDDQKTSDPIVAAYIGVKIWARAVSTAKEVLPASVMLAVENLSIVTPGGAIHVDEGSHHLWKYVFIGRIGKDGQFATVWNSSAPIRPIPFPSYMTKKEWQRFLTNLHRAWGGRWSAPSERVY